MRGYHVCSKQDMVALGAVLFRVKVDNDKTQFTQIPRMLKELVPNDQLKVMSTDEWKKVSSSTLHCLNNTRLKCFL